MSDTPLFDQLLAAAPLDWEQSSGQQPAAPASSSATNAAVSPEIDKAVLKEIDAVASGAEYFGLWNLSTTLGLGLHLQRRANIDALRFRVRLALKSFAEKNPVAFNKNASDFLLRNSEARLRGAQPPQQPQSSLRRSSPRQFSPLQFSPRQSSPRQFPLPHLPPPQFSPLQFLPPQFPPQQFPPPQFPPPQFPPPQSSLPQFPPQQFPLPQFLPPQSSLPQFLPPQSSLPQFLPPQSSPQLLPPPLPRERQMQNLRRHAEERLGEMEKCISAIKVAEQLAEKELTALRDRLRDTNTDTITMQLKFAEAAMGVLRAMLSAP
jgi:hypothetical protein